MAEKLKALERENRELCQANEILRNVSAYFASAPRILPAWSSTAGSSHDRFH